MQQQRDEETSAGEEEVCGNVGQDEEICCLWIQRFFIFSALAFSLQAGGAERKQSQQQTNSNNNRGNQERRRKSRKTEKIWIRTRILESYEQTQQLWIVTTTPECFWTSETFE